jgi:hypothetical protein
VSEEVKGVKMMTAHEHDQSIDKAIAIVNALLMLHLLLMPDERVAGDVVNRTDGYLQLMRVANYLARSEAARTTQSLTKSK